MTQDDERPRRRRRRRPSTAPGAPAASSTPSSPPPSPSGKRRDAAADRALRDVVGSGASQLSASRALRARDLHRPTDDELAAAERDVQLVRRNWQPTT
ncbi:hypothetical protein [Jatrophihabitans endophyticus]|uniref:hypothetical protein n=1 Tax=Jatrophihabitans endophyticus TaxID=1206085 RepID=UPI000932FC05|nr:hypothetical protein [Jatrophihabitans endophyticus]